MWKTEKKFGMDQKAFFFDTEQLKVILNTRNLIHIVLYIGFESVSYTLVSKAISTEELQVIGSVSVSLFLLLNNLESDNFLKL